MFSFASETFTFTAEGSCGRYAVTWYGLPAATRPVVQPVRSKSEPPAASKMNRETCRITSILEKLDGILSTISPLPCYGHCLHLVGAFPRTAGKNSRRMDKAGLALRDDSANACTSRARALDSFARKARTNSNRPARFVAASCPAWCRSCDEKPLDNDRPRVARSAPG